LSADCFAAFQEAGFTNETQMKLVGRKFRKTILEAGDGVDPAEAFRNFRGRDVDPNALLKLSFGSHV
jgi:oligopeptidase A